VAHRRAYSDISVRDVEIVFQLETRGEGHAEAIIAQLESHDLRVREETSHGGA
jgi:hypothetical protein